MDAQMRPLLAKSMDDIDLATFLSGGGGSIVDAIFYTVTASGGLLCKGQLAPQFLTFLRS